MEKETLYRFYKGEATSDEQRRLMEWLDADQENRRIFDRERGMYNALLLFAPEEKAARGRLLNWRRVTRYAVQAAAVVILAVGIGWGYVSYKERSWANLMTRVAAPEGQRINLTLQDGTNVWLNSGPRSNIRRFSQEIPGRYGFRARRCSMSAVTPAGRSWLRRSPVRLRCSARASTSMLTSGTMYSLRRSCAAASG